MKNLFSKLNDQDLSLFDAIKNGSVEQIVSAIRNGANINIFGEKYDVYSSISPLEYAIYCNAKPEIIVGLIDSGANINKVNEERKRSILEIVICFYYDNSIVDYLLQKGAQFPTEQHRCAFEGNIEALQITSENIDEIKTPSGCTLLHFAAAANKVNVAQWLIKERNAKVDEKDIFGLTALSCAASKGNLETIKWLLKIGGANINERSRRGLTPLLCAATKGQLEVVKWLLLEGGANIDEKDIEGYTALSWAAMYKRKEVTEWLSKYILDNTKNSDEKK